LDDIQRGSAWLGRAALELAHRDHADPGRDRQLLLRPIKQGAGGAALSGRDHAFSDSTPMKNARSIE
jgi:hypothetical protein